MNKFPHSIRSTYLRRGQSRYLTSPLKRGDLRPLHPDGELVSISLPCSDIDFRKLAVLTATSPKACLSVHSFRTPSNLGFLHGFSSLRRLMIDIPFISDTEAIKHLGPDLEELQLGTLTRSKRHSLHCLEGFRRLKVLWLEGPARDLEVIGGLKGLKELNLYGGKIPDLSKVKSLKSLQVLPQGRVAQRCLRAHARRRRNLAPDTPGRSKDHDREQNDFRWLMVKHGRNPPRT
jgi:hypothetical protein